MHKKSTKKKWIVVIGLLMVISALITYNFKLLKAYYYDFQFNKFTAGTKMYPPNYYMTDTISPTISLYRLIRPVNEDEIDAMPIEAWKKALMKNDIKSPDDLKMFETVKEIAGDSLAKYKNWCIGTYVDRKFIFINDEKFSSYEPYYQIKPNWPMVAETNTLLTKPLPDGYTYADDNYYVYAYYTRTYKDFLNKDMN